MTRKGSTTQILLRWSELVYETTSASIPCYTDIKIKSLYPNLFVEFIMYYTCNISRYINKIFVIANVQGKISRVLCLLYLTLKYTLTDAHPSLRIIFLDTSSKTEYSTLQSTIIIHPHTLFPTYSTTLPLQVLQKFHSLFTAT